MKKDSAINNMKRISANSQEAAAASEEVTASVEEQSGWLKNLSLQINEMKQSAVDLSDSINKFRM